MKRKKTIFYALHVFVIIVGLLLIVYSQKNKIVIDKLNEGEYVNSLHLVSLKDTVFIHFKKQKDHTNKYIGLFVYSDLCNACTLNDDNWEDIKQRYSEKTDFYAVNMSINRNNLGTKSNIKTYLIPDSTPKFAEDYKVPGVPYTVFLSSGGKVLYSEIGILDRKKRTKLDEIFK